MNKQDILRQLKAAKSAHIKWRSYAQALVSGVPVSEEKVPAQHTSCTFGTWYYGPGQILGGLPAFHAIEAPHRVLHEIYMQIFTLLFEAENKDAGFFRKLFGMSAKQANNREQVAQLLDSLIAVSRTLLEATEQLERDVQEMSEDEVAALG